MTLCTGGFVLVASYRTSVVALPLGGWGVLSVVGSAWWAWWQRARGYCVVVGAAGLGLGVGWGR